MLEGTIPALVSPFCNGKLDLDALRGVIRHVISGTVDGLLACGTTGESPTLSIAEWEAVVSTCVESCQGKPVIAGTGTNSTQATIERTLRAKSLGATAALIVVPYYNKPTQEGLLRHFLAVAEATRFPIVMYNIPGRTGVGMTPSTVATLAENPYIVGIKEASGSLDQVGAIISRVPSSFRVFSGDDSLSLPMYALGGCGVISTVANVAPKGMSEMYRAFKAGKTGEASALHYRLLPLMTGLFVETNPGPVKYALSQMGLIRDELRLPLVSVGESSRKVVSDALERCKGL